MVNKIIILFLVAIFIDQSSSFIFGGYFEYEGCVLGFGCWNTGKNEPSEKWKSSYAKHFKKIGAFENYSTTVSHLLHMITIEDFKYFFDVELPNKNGIPNVNPNLTVSDEMGVLHNIPRAHPPIKTPAAGNYAFIRYMNEWKNSSWGLNLTNNYERLIHAFHMQVLWTKAREEAEALGLHATNIDKIDKMCDGAMDFKENGVYNQTEDLFKFLKHNFTQKYLKDKKGLPVIDSLETWEKWRDYEEGPDPDYNDKAAGLFVYCVMKKYSPCCERKSLGGKTYTRVDNGKCVNDCIYKQDGTTDDLFYFANGGPNRPKCISNHHTTPPPITYN